MKTMEIDLRGRICPSTLLQTLKYVNKYKARLIKKELLLKILTDHRDALTTIPETLEKMGFSFKIEKVATYYKIFITKE